jgi:hypothetical protein
MTKEEFKTLVIGDMVVSRDGKGRARVLRKIGPSHYRQGLNEKEMFAWFIPIKGRRIRVVRAHQEIIYKIDFNA